jgi:hypothetical protein
MKTKENQEIKTKFIGVANGNTMRYLVCRGPKDSPLGLIEKERNTKTETFPWKAFAGVGYACAYIGAFYGPSGKQRAIAAVADPSKANPD